MENAFYFTSKAPFVLFQYFKYGVATSSRYLSVTEEGMSVISRHSRLEYWVLAKYYFFRAVDLPWIIPVLILGKMKINFLFSQFSVVPQKVLWHTTFWDTTKKCENKNSSYLLFYYNFLKCTAREGLKSLYSILVAPKSDFKSSKLVFSFRTSSYFFGQCYIKFRLPIIFEVNLASVLSGLINV